MPYVQTDHADMPDAVTCPQTPRDQYGHPITPERTYYVTRAKMVKDMSGDSVPMTYGASQKVKIQEDPQGDLWVMPYGGDRWQRVDQIDPLSVWVRA